MSFEYIFRNMMGNYRWSRLEIIMFCKSVNGKSQVL